MSNQTISLRNEAGSEPLLTKNERSEKKIKIPEIKVLAKKKNLRNFVSFKEILFSIIPNYRGDFLL